MARLPLTVDDINAVPEPHRSLYEQQNGKYVLAVEGLDPSATGVATEKNRLKALAKDLENKLLAYQQLGDVESLAEVKRAHQTLLEQSQRSNGEWDKILASTKKQLVEEHNKEVGALRAENQQLSGEITSVLLDGAVRGILEAEGGIPELAMPHLQKVVKIEKQDGKHVVTVLGEDGTPRVKGDGKPVTVRELIAEMKQDAILGRAFVRPGSAGSGAPSHQLGGAGGGKQALMQRVRGLPPVERLAEARRLGL